MAYNVVEDSVKTWLVHAARTREFGRLETGRQDKLEEFIVLALFRPLSKQLAQQNRPDNLQKMPEGEMRYSNHSWLRAAFHEGEVIYRFRPDTELLSQIRHIIDWIAAAMENDADWLRQLDDRGRPKKLRKIGSLDQATKEANKAMLIYAQRAAANGYDDAHGHEKTVKTYGDGYRMVQLLTPGALDRESGYLGHCVGNGAYDAGLKAGRHEFYSLRDANGKGHATLEVRLEDNALLQCKGKQNAPPVSKYMPHIQAFLKDRRYKLQESPRHTGLVEQDGVYYDINHLPENFHYKGYLDLANCTGLTTLPDGLQVGGSLSLIGCIGLVALPTGLQVDENLYLTRCAGLSALPEDLNVGGNLDLSGCVGLTVLPEDLNVGKNIDLSGCAGLTVLPEGFLKVSGNFNLDGCCGLTALPMGLQVGGYLDLSICSGLTVLPAGLQIGKDLDLWNCKNLTALPAGLQIGGGLNLFGCTGLTALPDDLEVKGSIWLQNGTQCQSVNEARAYFGQAPIESQPAVPQMANPSL